MNNISSHISYAEATKSQTAERAGFSNTPDEATIIRMKLVAEKCFEPARLHFGAPLRVSSFYRSPKLNAKVRGSKTSQHITGEAIDIDCDGLGEDGPTNAELFNWLSLNVDFDQLIWEYGDNKNPAWVHVSYSSSGKQRKERLRYSIDHGNVIRSIIK